jgi:hypothetical protein
VFNSCLLSSLARLYHYGLVMGSGYMRGLFMCLRLILAINFKRSHSMRYLLPLQVFIFNLAYSLIFGAYRLLLLLRSHSYLVFSTYLIWFELNLFNWRL